MEPDPDEHVHPGQEDIRWGSGVKDKERNKSSAPSAKYNKLSEQARKLITGDSQCAMFCGGKKCKYCTAFSWKPEQMAINGLYSEWVTDNILAMARPSNRGFDKYKIVEQFIDNNIKTVINLQQPGEHASCGRGNDSSGFSYNPQRLMDKDIFFYNFAWQDYGIAPMPTLLDIVKVMQFGVSMGKVAIHCHAGLGRTGLLIACYLVYNNRMKAGDAVRYVRSRRAGAIQTSQQVNTVYGFETYLKPFRTIFPSRIEGASEVSFKHFLNRQSHVLHGFEARKLKHIPKVVYVCCERLLELAGRGRSLYKIRPESDSPSTASITASSHNPHQFLQPRGFAHSFSQLSVRSENNIAQLSTKHHMSLSLSLEDLNDAKFKKVLSGSDREDQLDNSSSGAGSLDYNPEGDVRSTGNESKDSNDGDGNGGSHDELPNSFKSASSGKVGEKEGEDDEEDDDDCIVFGRVSNAVEFKDNAVSFPQSEDHAVKSETVSDEEQARDQSQDATGNSGGERHPMPSCADQTTGSNSSANNGTDSGKKRHGKRKGLGERLKGRGKKSEGKEEKNDSGVMNGVENHGAEERAAEEIGKHGESNADYEHGESNADYEHGESNAGKHVDLHAEVSKPEIEIDYTVVDYDLTLENVSRLVTEAMAASEYPADVRIKVDHLEDELNETDEAWTMMADEQDPFVLSAVLYDWLDQLTEPVLSRQNLNLLLERSGSPKECLHRFEKSVKHFIEYQALVLSKLFPQSEDLETRLAERLLSHLTHMSVNLNLSSFVTPNLPPHWGEMKSSEAQLVIKFFFKLIDEVALSRTTAF